MKIFTILFLAVLYYVFPDFSFAYNGDTLNLFSHNKTFVVTDPKSGLNSYKNNVIFPSEEIKPRKAVLRITYECPDGLNCGEWDYIDYIYLKKKTGYQLNGTFIYDTSRIEIARMISPYGSRFTPDWKFEWKTDITDFGFLLHDSAEVDFIHTGYENNKDRGWLITIKFELTEGTPVLETVGFEKLWSGVFPYGNSQDDIRNYLQPYKFKNSDADIAGLRILQTGHGMDDFENCAEFCSKWRDIYFNGELKERKQIWRECADNPLQPQAGTWIFDRAGWCPGAIVEPDKYYFHTDGNAEHTLKLELEPYVNPNKPTANYVISAYLFFYKKPVAENDVSNDVSLEEIISPSMEDMYSGRNPVSMFPVIRVKNNAYRDLEKITVSYGVNGNEEEIFDWTGLIRPFELMEIVLPGILDGKDRLNIFNVTLHNPNGEPDEYEFDNKGSSEFSMPPVFDQKIIVKIKTNKEPADNLFQLRGNKLLMFRHKPPGFYKPDTLYVDTINLRKGEYEIIFADTADNGLDFWFNPEGGYGYFRITDTTGKLIKAYNGDFGKEIRQSFIVNGESSQYEDITPLLNIFPVRNPGKFFCDIFLNEKQNIKIEIFTEDKKKRIYRKSLKNFKEGMVDVDISKVDDGNYFVNVIAGKKNVSKKIKVKRDK